MGEELIVKKDSQMILKDLKSKKQKAHYIWNDSDSFNYFEYFY
jgi:hypothetical protein